MSPHRYENASITILDALHMAERDMVGTTVTTFSGASGEVVAVRLNDLHGLQFTFDRHMPGTPRHWRPVSTIKVHKYSEKTK